MTTHNRGGKRPGAGRPRADAQGAKRSKHTIYCTQDELLKVRTYLKILRQNADLKANPDTSQISLFMKGES